MAAFVILASIRTLNEQQASLKSKDNEFAIKLRDSERRAKIAETEAAAARRETEEVKFNKKKKSFLKYHN